ncbi:plasmid replication initiator TrfA [Paraburkholderia caledonica]|uniref:plasmid replication initiator TrfA n=1 Tax=Paraburkholderia caledonica TaxID=134536 RepID=UPI0038B90EC9
MGFDGDSPAREASGTETLVRRIKEIAARATRLGERCPEHQQAHGQLPLWPEATRGTPNLWLRGALFAAIHGKDRRALQRVLLATVSGIEIRFTGWQLEQSDLDVWEAVVHLARVQQLGRQVEFSAYKILKTLCRPNGTSEREWLRNSFARLAGAVIEIKAGALVFFGALLRGARDEDSGGYVIELDPRLAAIYETGWTQIDWPLRRQLRGKPLALWLHGWYSSHAKPYPVRIETIRRLSGSTNSHAGSFQRQLGRALDELAAVGALKGWSFRDGLVHVERRPTASQARYLVGRAAKPREKVRATTKG